MDYNAPQPKVYNIADWDQLESWLPRYVKMGEQGLWTKSVLTDKDANQMVAGRAASQIQSLHAWSTVYRALPGSDVKFANLYNPVRESGFPAISMAVSATSENPERALMFLDVINYDKEMYQLYSYGIEGVDYTLENGDAVLTDTGNFPQENGNWGWQNTAFSLTTKGGPPTYRETRDALDAQQQPDKLKGLVIDPTPVKNEYTAVGNVIKEYYYPLILGYVDPVTGLAELRDQLQKAGNDKVEAEFQRQVDEFLAKKG